MLRAPELYFVKHWHKAEVVLRLQSLRVESASFGPDTQVSVRVSQLY